MGGNEVYIRYDSGNLSITQSNCYIGRGEAISYLVQKAFDMLKKDVGAHLIKPFTKTFHVGDWGGPDYSTSSHIPNSKVIPCPFFHGWKEANIEDYSTECLKITKQSHIPYIHSKMLWVGRLTCQARKDFIKNYSSHSKIKTSYLPEDWGHIPKLPTDYVSLSDHCKYKYLIDIEGMGYSARSKFFLHSRRPLFYQKRRWNEYWFWDLKEYKHYIPVANNLSDLSEKIEWAEANPDKCKEIADNAADFAANNLRKKDAIKRLRDILYELGTGELNKSLFTEQTKAFNINHHKDMPKMYFVTVSNRPQHLKRLADSIVESGVASYFNFTWVLRFDLDVSDVPVESIEYIDELPFKVDYKFLKDSKNNPGGNYTRDIVIKNTPSGVWLWQFDDDNSVHSDYGKEIRNCIDKNPDKSIIVVWQKDRFRPTQISDIVLGRIGAANYTWKSDASKNIEFPCKYGGDGVFIENMLKLNKDKAIIIHKDLCYYNTHAHMNHLKTKEVSSGEGGGINTGQLMTKNTDVIVNVKQKQITSHTTNNSTIKPSKKENISEDSFSISLVNKVYGSNKLILTIGSNNIVKADDMPDMLYKKVSPNKFVLFNKSTSKKIGEILKNKHTGEYYVSLDVGGKTNTTSWVGRKLK